MKLVPETLKSSPVSRLVTSFKLVPETL